MAKNISSAFGIAEGLVFPDNETPSRRQREETPKRQERKIAEEGRGVVSPTKTEAKPPIKDTIRQDNTSFSALNYETPEREGKTRRMQIVVQPSLHEAISKTAKKKGLSVNEAICRAIAQYVEREF